MVPDPNVPDWKASGVLWYPAKFIERHPQHERTSREYEFEWMECNDGILFHTADDLTIPSICYRAFHRSRKFCEGISAVQLSGNQIGKVRLPWYMKPDDPEHNNPELTAIFIAAIPQVAKILADFDEGHPVVAAYNDFFKTKKLIDRHREAGDWMRTFNLVPTPELEAVLSDPLISLMKHTALADIQEPECHRRVMAVGSALLQLLAVQHVLGEQLNLNGDMMNDLRLGEVEWTLSDGPVALTAMFNAIPLVSSRSGDLAVHMVQFNHSHAIYDREFRPPTFRRERESSKLSPAILVAVKRKGDDKIDLPPKRRQFTQANTGSSTSKPQEKHRGSTKNPDQKSKTKKRRPRWKGYVELDSDGNEIARE
ncbi:hypothetical protein C8R45DRAFT_1011858 [Mycena sanguinolenta]|nr:hypothetical protein C8R45DRAFT_1011858 [Mycena sanguinolenta]